MRKLANAIAFELQLGEDTLTYPGQQAFTKVLLPFFFKSSAMHLVIEVMPALDVAYAALGQPSCFSLPAATADLKPSISAVTS
jgi:hypothetical protein